MSDYKISVIIPIYNAENYIVKAIDSLVNQNFGFENIEVVLVDDTSTDSTRDIIKNLASKHENIKCIFNEKNSGSASKPRNIGIENATTDYIMFMDNDDWYYPDMCKVMYESITKENTDIVTCRFVFDNDGPIKEKSFLDEFDPIIKINSIYEMPQLMTTTQPGFIWNKIFKKSFIKKYNIHFPDGMLYEDIYFMAQAYINASSILLLNNFWGYHYNVLTGWRGKSLSDTFDEENLMKRFEGLKRIFNILNSYNADFPSLKAEMLVGWTKLFIYTNPENGKELLKKAKGLYSQYHLTTRILVIGLPLNIAVNIFMAIFKSNTTIAMMITKIYAMLLSAKIVSRKRKRA